MSNTVRKTVTSFTTQRVEFTSTKSIKQTLSILDEELNKDKAGLALKKIIYEAHNKDEIEAGLETLLEGKRDFLCVSLSVVHTSTMYSHFSRFFWGLSHSVWMRKYFGGSVAFPEAHVITLGNPLTAATIVPHDSRAGLYAPVRVLVQETQEGGTLVAYDLPSSGMIRPESTDELKNAAHALDATLEKLFNKIL